MAYVVVGTSPYYDTSVAVGTYKLAERAAAAAKNLERKGWNAEIVPLSTLGEVKRVK